MTTLIVNLLINDAKDFLDIWFPQTIIWVNETLVYKQCPGACDVSVELIVQWKPANIKAN